MKRFIIAAVALVAGAAAAAQPAPTTQAADQRIVAVINGETITNQKLNDLYYSMNPQMRAQYDLHGGKAAFLDIYVRKRLVVQEAMKTGFDKKPEVQAAMDSAKDSALFDKYVRDVVATQLVTDSDAQKYYDSHLSEFATPESVRAYQIVLLTTGANAMTKEQAAAQIGQIASKIRSDVAATNTTDPKALAKITLSYFKNAARQYSQDSTSNNGGDLGWVSQAQLDKAFGEVAFKTQPGTMSDPVQSQYGFHLIYVEAKRPAGTASFADVSDSIRERLMADRTGEIMAAVQRLTAELEKAGKVSVSPDNIQ